MKTLFLSMLLLSSLVKADVIILYPAILINTQISNINEYPDTRFVVCSVSNNPVYYPDYYIGCDKLKGDQIIEGYRPHFNSTHLFAIPKTVYESVDINATLKQYMTAVNQTSKNSKSINIIPFFDMSDHEYPIDEETRVYKITSVTDNNVTLKLEKRIIHFTDGEANKTILY